MTVVVVDVVVVIFVVLILFLFAWLAELKVPGHELSVSVCLCYLWLVCGVYSSS